MNILGPDVEKQIWRMAHEVAFSSVIKELKSFFPPIEYTKVQGEWANGQWIFDMEKAGIPKNAVFLPRYYITY